MQREQELIRKRLCRAYSLSSGSGSDSDQEGEGVSTRASARLVQAQPEPDPVRSPSIGPQVESESEPEGPAEASQPEPIDSNILFRDKKEVIKNNDIKLYVYRDYLKRQKIFRLEDHLFQLKAEVIKDRAPLISSILNVLEEALKHVIGALKQNYKPGKLIYFFTSFYIHSNF